MHNTFERRALEPSRNCLSPRDDHRCSMKQQPPGHPLITMNAQTPKPWFKTTRMQNAGRNTERLLTVQTPNELS
eukprot:5656405-Lingulodinium_polyedra.AAC.1